MFAPITEENAYYLRYTPFFLNCLACETDVEIETLLTFCSTSADYQVLNSHLQLVGYDYYS